MPRGRALGMVMQLPDGDQTSYSRKQMLARLDVCMGGRVAEELVYGSDNVTSGASSDIQQATRLARAMVTKYGLSDKVGVMFLDDKDKSSGDTQRDVDSEVRALLTDSYSRAKKVLTQYRRELDLIAGGLLRYESLSGEEVMELCNGLQPDVNGQRSQRPSRPISILSLNKGGGSGAAGGASGGAKGVDAAIAAATAATNVPPPTPSSGGRSGGFTGPPEKKGAAPVSANKGAGQQPITTAPTTASSRLAPLAAASPAVQPTGVTNTNTNKAPPLAPTAAPPAVSEPSSSQAAQASQATATAAPAAGKAGGGGFFSGLFSSSSPSSTTTTTTNPQDAAAVSVSASASSAQTSGPVVVSTQQAPAKTQAQAQTTQAQAQAQAQALSSKAAASSLGQGQGQAVSAQKKQPEAVSAVPPRGPPKP